MNRKKLYRLYREEKLMVRRRGGRKRALGTRAPMVLPLTINQRWSLDFVSDTLSDGRRFRISASSTTSAANAWPWWSILRWVACASCANLNGWRWNADAPRVIVSDNGTELTSGAVLRWAIETACLALHRARQAGAECFHRIVQ